MENKIELTEEDFDKHSEIIIQYNKVKDLESTKSKVLVIQLSIVALQLLGILILKYFFAQYGWEKMTLMIYNWTCSFFIVVLFGVFTYYHFRILKCFKRIENLSR